MTCAKGKCLHTTLVAGTHLRLNGSRYPILSAPNTIERCFYTVNHKKRDILFLTITLANLNRFL